MCIRDSPEGAAFEMRTEQLERRGIGVGDAVQPDLGEDLSGVDLDVLQLR